MSQDDFVYDEEIEAAPKRKVKKPAGKKVAKKAKEPDPDSAEAIGDNARQQLAIFVDRIESLEKEKADIAADIKEVYDEAKSFGYDTKIVRKVIAARKQDRHEREEQQALFDLYWDALEGYKERADAGEMEG